MSCVFPLHNSATCGSARHWMTYPITVCVHVHKLQECNDFDRAPCTRSAFQVSHDTFHVHLVTFCRTADFSCCFLHSVHDVCSCLAHVQQLSPQLFCTLLVTHFPAQQVILVVGVLVTLGVVTGFASSRQRTAMTSRNVFLGSLSPNTDGLFF